MQHTLCNKSSIRFMHFELSNVVVFNSSAFDSNQIKLTLVSIRDVIQFGNLGNTRASICISAFQINIFVFIFRVYLFISRYDIYKFGKLFFISLNFRECAFTSWVVFFFKKKRINDVAMSAFQIAYFYGDFCIF